MSQSANKLLAALPRGDYERLRPVLRTLHLSAEAGLPHCGQTRVYFPGSGLCSIFNKMADGAGIEVACVGNEGVVGLFALATQSPDRRNGFVQVADGTIEYMPAMLFEQELARNAVFREAVDRFCHLFLETVIQAVACNRLHTIEERCCRWLLSVHDRLQRGRFELKVRFLARAMGVKTADVAGILTSLAERALVSHDGDSITILDPMGLKRQACGCYTAMKRAYTAGPMSRPPASPDPERRAKVLTMGRGAAVCTFCGLSTANPHINIHACITALDAEIASTIQRTHTLRKYRAQLVANRVHLYRDILKRLNARI